MLHVYTAVSTGNCQTHINKGTIEDTMIVAPPYPIMKRYNSVCSSLCELIINNALQSKELTILRDFLLPLLMNGQVRVKAEQPINLKTLDRRHEVFKRLILSAYILDNICDEPTAGRVKFEKILNLSEYCAQIPLHSDFFRYAAGPYAPKSLYSIEKQLEKNKWFQRKIKKNKSNIYVRLEKINNYKQYIATNFTQSQKTVIDKLLNLFKKAKTEQCEIVATLYGAWNDFLIRGKKPNDDQIVDEVLTNWHEKKKLIERQRWLKALEWMREKDIVPAGYGISTKDGKK